MSRTKRIAIPAVLAAAALVVGGVFWATSASADLSGDERDRVAAAATKAAGGGEVVDAERDDADPDDSDPLDRVTTYDVELRQSDGTEVDVVLGSDLTVLSVERDGRDATDDSRDDRADDAADRSDQDADDRVLSATERTRAADAARTAVGGAGTLATDVDAGDDPGVAYEVEVRTRAGQEFDVDLDRDLAVVSKTASD